MRHLSIEQNSVHFFKVSFWKILNTVSWCFLQMFILFSYFIVSFFNLGTASKCFNSLPKRFNKKWWNVQQQSRCGLGVSYVSKSAENSEEYPFFWNGWNHLFNQESPSLIFRTEQMTDRQIVKKDMKMAIIIIQILEKIKTRRVNFQYLIWAMDKRIFLNGNWILCEMRERGNLFR